MGRHEYTGTIDTWICDMSCQQSTSRSSPARTLTIVLGICTQRTPRVHVGDNERFHQPGSVERRSHADVVIRLGLMLLSRYGLAHIGSVRA